MSNIDLLVQKLTEHESTQKDSERRAKGLISQAELEVEKFVELAEDALKLPASKKLLHLTRYHHEHEAVVEGSLHKIKLIGLKVAVAGRTVSLKPMAQPWEGRVSVRFFLEGTKDDSRSIVRGEYGWELSKPMADGPKPPMDREGIAGLFVELL